MPLAAGTGDWGRRGAGTRRAQILAKVPRHIPRLAFRASSSASKRSPPRRAQLAADVAVTRLICPSLTMPVLPPGASYVSRGYPATPRFNDCKHHMGRILKNRMAE